MTQASIKALDHAIGLRRFGFCQAVLDAQRLAQFIKLMLTSGLAAVSAKQAISEFFAVIREDGANLEGCRCVLTQ